MSLPTEIENAKENDFELLIEHLDELRDYWGDEVVDWVKNWVKRGRNDASRKG